MAIRKSMEERLVVQGQRETWLGRVSAALAGQPFKNATTSPAVFQASAKYRTFRVVGDLVVTVNPLGAGSTELTLVSTANVDNLFALGASPNRKILDEFKRRLA